MRYEKSERIQGIETYCCPVSFFGDVLETLFDESNDAGMVHIIADDFITEKLIKFICAIKIEGFDFDLQSIDFDKNIDDEFRITILDNGEVDIEPSTNDKGEYFECDGFIFADIDVDEDAFNGENRRCDTIIFEIESFDCEENE